MLLSLHVKNLALIEEAEINFKKGLNILTGETGAGKSIIIGSINLALGAKAGSEVIGRHGDSALIELTFVIDDKERIKKLNEMDIFVEDNILTITRRIMEGRSVIKVNGETTTAAAVRKITGLLIDIHGQHDHQSLLYKSKHLEILDKYAKNELAEYKSELGKEYKLYKECLRNMENFTISEEERMRNVDFLSFEIEEIDNANIKSGEDEDIETEYKRIVNSKTIMQELDSVRAVLDSDNGVGVSELIGRACSIMNSVTRYDSELETLGGQLSEIDSLLNDFNHDVISYMDSFEFDAEHFAEIEKRLDTINTLKSKYGGSIESIAEYRSEAGEKLDFYEQYEIRHKEAVKQKEDTYNRVLELCDKITEIRQKAALELSEKIRLALLDLNFEQTQFGIDIRKSLAPSADGYDEAEFMISVNPGEEKRPLAKIASGGELSRIMLGIKSVLAGKDEIDTLIFDEIDTGISGRTAQKVSEKMAIIASGHQVICITHLPQIAAMADCHFEIIKQIKDGYTTTSINALSDEEIIEELARMLGGTEITDIVRENAKQMKESATAHKAGLNKN